MKAVHTLHINIMNTSANNNMIPIVHVVTGKIVMKAENTVPIIARINVALHALDKAVFFGFGCVDIFCDIV